MSTIPMLQTASSTRRFVHAGQTWSLEALGIADSSLEAALDFIERFIKTSEQPMAGMLQVHGCLVRFSAGQEEGEDDALNGRR